MSVAGITIRHDLRPGDLGMVVHLHGVLYAQEHGLDTSFEPYVAKPLADLVLAGSDAGRLWLAECDGRIVGSIAALLQDEASAQLRWFLLTPEARGAGLGRRMLESALDYCRERRVASVFLWTFADLGAAIRLYERAGFRESESVAHEVWGGKRTELRMDLRLGSTEGRAPNANGNLPSGPRLKD